MRNPILLVVSLLLTCTSIHATNTTDNKTKRGIIGQTLYYGESQPAIRYTQTPILPDSTSSAATSPLGYNQNNQRPILFQAPTTTHLTQVKPDGDPTKQLTVQQILYDLQQTPQSIISGLPSTQPFQLATEQRPEFVQPQFVNQPHPLNVEPNQYNGIITPVQHGAVINHGQGYTKLLFNPYNIQTANLQNNNNNNNPQPKYIYSNGKILYQQQPLAVNLHNINNNPYPGITIQARPHNYLTNLNLQQRHPQVVTQKPLFKPSPLIPITFNNRYTSAIISTTSAPVKQAENEDKDTDARNEELEEDDDSEDHSNYEEEEEEDFKPSYFSKFRYESDEDDDHEHYREDDEDEDNTRSYTKHVRKSPKKSVKSKRKSNNKNYKNDHYKNKKDHEKSYKTSETDYANKKQPKSQYKSYKYYKASSNHAPKKEILEGHQSQNVPVVHNKKVIRQEKWLVTKKENN